MGVYDRDWYREDYKERNKIVSIDGYRDKKLAGFKPKKAPKGINSLLVIAISFAAIAFAARMYCGYCVTAGIIGANIVMFLLIFNGKISIYDTGASYFSTILNKQYGRIITAAFTQQEVFHLVCNVVSLYNAGRYVELLLGSTLFLAVYVIIMLVGGYVSCLLHKHRGAATVSIGASGVICGIFGVYLSIAFCLYGAAAIRSVFPTLALLMLMTVNKRIDSIGHFTGLAVGLVLGFLLLKVM
ncbi:MAG: rhomboid family intramembrane serine protease [Eubacteriales bacterium]|nr:rhomboid family intramembrane serine protease [Eubacteriales bacterium]